MDYSAYCGGRTLLRTVANVFRQNWRSEEHVWDLWQTPIVKGNNIKPYFIAEKYLFCLCRGVANRIYISVCTDLFTSFIFLRLRSCIYHFPIMSPNDKFKESLNFTFEWRLCGQITFQNNEFLYRRKLK